MKLLELGFYALFHLVHRDTRENKSSVHVAVTAEHVTFRPVRIRSSTLLIALERHTAALTICVRGLHIFAPQLIRYYVGSYLLVKWACDLQLIHQSFEHSTHPLFLGLFLLERF